MHEVNYKDRPAIVVESGSFIATILPQDGGKMASLRVRNTGKELLVERKQEKYRVLAYDGDFESSECSGFDDMFPTIDPYTPTEGAYKGITYPDHGEICRVTHIARPFGEGVVLNAKSKIFPIDYQKTILPAGDGGIDIEYRITNNGEVPFPFLWAGHVMLQGEPGIGVFTPFDKDAATEMMPAPEGIPESELPQDRLMDYEPGKGAVYKFYYVEPMKEGYFGLSYPDGSRLTFKVDTQKTPYLGIWFGNGGFQDLYSIILEPCTVPFDAPDRARQRGYTSVIPGNNSFTFGMHISIEGTGGRRYEDRDE